MAKRTDKPAAPMRDGSGTPAAEPPSTSRVYPHPDLAARGEYLAGVGTDGADVPRELANEWVSRGLAVRRREG